MKKLTNLKGSMWYFKGVTKLNLGKKNNQKLSAVTFVSLLLTRIFAFP